MEIINNFLKNLPSLADLLVYGSIAIITIVGFLKCILPVLNTGSALKRGIRRLKKHSQSENPAWKDVRFLGGILESNWEKYLLNSEQLLYRGLSLNTDDFINDETVVHIPGNGAFAELIPSLLTSLGILGTFIGLMSGLGGLDFTNTESIISAIPVLLTGMSFAFATSIAGISCSLLFNVIYRISAGRAFKAIDSFSETFCAYALRRAPDDSVMIICQNQDRNVLLHGVAEDMSTRVAASIESALTEAMIPVTQSMDRFIAVATREQVEGIGRVASQFVVKMNESLSDQFVSLGKTMTEVNQSTLVSNDTLRTSLSTVSSLITDMQTMHRSSTEILSRFESYIHTLKEQRDGDKEFQSTVSDLIFKMHNSQEQQTRCAATLNEYQTKLEKTLREYTTWSDEIIDGVKRQGESTANETNLAAKAFNDSSALLSQSYSAFVENITEGLSKSLGMFEENIHDMLRVLSEKADKLANASAENGQLEAYSSLQRTMADIQKTLSIKEEG